MNEKIKAILASDEFWEGLGEKIDANLSEQRAQRASFVQSQTFKNMVQSMTSTHELRVLDNETFAYFPDETKQRLGWENYCNEDIEQFMDVMYHADGLDKSFRKHDDACIFENERFEFQGLFVFVMWGQGMALTIRNQAIQALDEHVNT